MAAKNKFFLSFGKVQTNITKRGHSKSMFVQNSHFLPPLVVCL